MTFRFIVFFALAALIFTSYVSAGQSDIIALTNVGTTPSSIYPGDIVTINFTVQNASATGQIAEETVVSFGELNSNYFEVVKGSENLGSISGRDSKPVSLRLNVLANVLPGNYQVPIKVTYMNGTTQLTHTDEINLDLSSCRILKVEDIALSSSTPHIGDTLGISATIKNVCATSARNVGVELRPVSKSTIAPFVVPEGTTKKIGDMPPMGSAEVSFSVLLGDRVAADTYVFSIDANCDDCTKTFTNQFSFLALGKPELVFSSIDYSVEGALGNDKQIMQGSPFTLSIQLDNIGKEKAKAVEVVIDFGSGIKGAGKSFLGNIDPDDSGAAVFSLSAGYDAKPGAQPGTITVRYIDETAKTQEFSQTYSLYVNEVPPTSPVVYIFILVLLIAVLGLIYFIVRFVFRQLAIRKAQSR
ncbi:MAG TPA: hypothetical protein VJH23_04665 [archaeon]|nr:hypothetical protein [archaeon]